MATPEETGVETNGQVEAPPENKPKPPAAKPKALRPGIDLPTIDLGLVKAEPWSEGIATPRKKKPPELAVTNDCCTGCAGSPVCITYCPVEECMYWVPDEDHPPFGRINVDYQLCIGCKKCISKGPDDTFLDGCPWDAIDMVPTAEVEQTLGVKFNY
jgi:ferredoxin